MTYLLKMRAPQHGGTQKKFLSQTEKNFVNFTLGFVNRKYLKE